MVRDFSERKIHRNKKMPPAVILQLCVCVSVWVCVWGVWGVYRLYVPNTTHESEEQEGDVMRWEGGSETKDTVDS